MTKMFPLSNVRGKRFEKQKKISQNVDVNNFRKRGKQKDRLEAHLLILRCSVRCCHNMLLLMSTEQACMYMP